METNTNGLLSPEAFDKENELPLIPLGHDLDRRRRAKALSQLSLQSLSSDYHNADDATDGDDDEPVGMTTMLNYSLLSFVISLNYGTIITIVIRITI